MARKRYGEDDVLRLILEIEVHCNSGMEVLGACRSAGVPSITGRIMLDKVGNSTCHG